LGNRSWGGLLSVRSDGTYTVPHGSILTHVKNKINQILFNIIDACNIGTVKTEI
jgi:hypothetical protein